MATVAASTQECSNAVLEQAHSVQSREELTKTQREIVEKTWGPISSDLQAAGILLFKRYALYNSPSAKCGSDYHLLAGVTNQEECPA